MGKGSFLLFVWVFFWFSFLRSFFFGWVYFFYNRTVTNFPPTRWADLRVNAFGQKLKCPSSPAAGTCHMEFGFEHEAAF